MKKLRNVCLTLSSSFSLFVSIGLCFLFLQFYCYSFIHLSSILLAVYYFPIISSLRYMTTAFFLTFPPTSTSYMSTKLPKISDKRTSTNPSMLLKMPDPHSLPIYVNKLTNKTVSANSQRLIHLQLTQLRLHTALLSHCLTPTTHRKVTSTT